MSLWAAERNLWISSVGEHIIGSTQLRADGGSVGQLAQGGKTKRRFRGFWRPLVNIKQTKTKINGGWKYFTRGNTLWYCTVAWTTTTTQSYWSDGWLAFEHYLRGVEPVVSIVSAWRTFQRKHHNLGHGLANSRYIVHFLRTDKREAVFSTSLRRTTAVVGRGQGWQSKTSKESPLVCW